MSQQANRAVKTAVVGITAAALLALCGCDGSSSKADRAVQDARVTLQTLSIGGSNVGGGAPAATRKKAYEEVVRSLSGLSPTKPTQKATVSALLARGHAGLAELEVQKATTAEAEVLRATLLVQTGLDQWLQQSSTASALGQFDITGASGEIDAKVAELKAQLGAATEALRQSESEQARLNEQIAGNRQQASAARDQENQIRQQMVSADEVRRLELLEQAGTHRRQADELEQKAGYLEAELVKVKPETDSKRREVSRLETTIRLMNQTRTGLEDKAAATRKAAAEAQADAEQARAKLDERLSALDAARQQATEPWTQAAELYSKAASTIQQGGGVNKDKGLDRAAYLQLAADAHWALSRSSAGYAALMNRLAMIDGLGGGSGGDFAGRAQSAQQQADAERQQAAELYQQAVDALGGVQQPMPEGENGNADGQGGGESLANRLDTLRKKIAVVNGDEPAADEAAPAAEDGATDDGTGEDGMGEGAPAADDAAGMNDGAGATDEPAAGDAPEDHGGDAGSGDEPAGDEEPQK